MRRASPDNSGAQPAILPEEIDPDADETNSDFGRSPAEKLFVMQFVNCIARLAHRPVSAWHSSPAGFAMSRFAGNPEAAHYVWWFRLVFSITRNYPRPVKRSPLTHKHRVSLRDIADAAKVCLMTVSLALRDSPKISAVTRARVQKLARQLGYQPDPELSRLMKHLRLSRTAEGKTGVAVIDFYPETSSGEIYYSRRIRQGAAARAAELGFTVTM